MSGDQKQASRDTVDGTRRPRWWMVFGGIVVLLVLAAVVIDLVNRQQQVPPVTDQAVEGDSPTIEMMQSIDKLKALNAEAASRYATATLPARIEILNQRKQISRRILALAKKASDKQFANNNLIQVQSQLHALYLSNTLPTEDARRELQQLITAFETDSNVELARTASVAKLTLSFADLHAAPESPEALTAFKSSIQELIRRFPDDLEVVANLDSIISAAVESKTLESVLGSLLDTLHDSLIGSPAEGAHLLAHKARDERILRRLEYPRIYRTLVAGNVSARQEYLQLVRRAAEERLSPVGLSRLIADVRWSEGYQWWDEARESYALVWENINTQVYERAIMQTLARRVTDECTAGLQRLDMLAKPLQISGLDFRQQVIDPERYKGRVIWLAFFRDPEALRDLQYMFPQLRALSGRGLQVVFVFSNIPKTDNADVTESLLWTNSTIVIEPGFRGEFGRQIPMSFDVYSVIVGADGTVKELAVPNRQLLTRLEANLYIANQTDHPADKAETIPPSGGD